MAFKAPNKKPPKGGKDKKTLYSSASHSLNRPMPSVMAVAPKKENEADKLCHQQNEKLIPSLAIGGVDAAAEDVEHQRRDHIAGQGQQPFCHQSQKRHKERNRKKSNFSSA